MKFLYNIIPKSVVARIPGSPNKFGHIRLDELTHSLLTMSHAHHEIHHGHGFYVTQDYAAAEFDIAAPFTLQIVTPDTTNWCHIVWEVAATATALFEVFEDNGNADHYNISGGDSNTPEQKNRNSENTSDMTCTTGVTVTKAESDVKIYSTYVGGFKSPGSNIGRHERILKQGTAYLFRFTSIADNNEGSMNLFWYEHDPSE